MEGLGCIKLSWGFNNYETFGSAKRHTFYQSVVWTCIWGGDWRATSPFNLGSNVWVRNFLCKSDISKCCFPTLLFLCSLIMSQKEQNQPKPTTQKKIRKAGICSTRYVAQNSIFFSLEEYVQRRVCFVNVQLSLHLNVEFCQAQFQLAS